MKTLKGTEEKQMLHLYCSLPRCVRVRGAEQRAGVVLGAGPVCGGRGQLRVCVHHRLHPPTSHRRMRACVFQKFIN
ncbi:hypothetical protein E2C01_039698 [Portunus trituberculatus]|uniref:Uncharacterized protein n=1 Tax=Portunus trituberculatus TaxID=210409 RepID=A0A5B7FHQ0_PORTR|nr:hypothetical protein [Portunus trituberculatus]